MQNRMEPRLARWPFLAGDALLFGTAWFIYFQSKLPMGPWQIFFIVVCVIAGACLGIMPFLLEYRVTARLLESTALNDAMAQLQQLQALANQISTATASWNNVQENAGRTAASSQELVQRITAEARSFGESLQRANDSEKAALKLEVEKLRRAETEWLQSMVRVLDHIYALHQGGVRSGQPRLAEQLSNFQNSCREAVRRVGVVPFIAEKAETFDPQRHQLLEGDPVSFTGTPVSETIATGYLFQGKLIRPALVKLVNGEAEGEGRGRAARREEDPQNELPLESSAAEH